jgi:hypothetical protein
MNAMISAAPPLELIAILTKNMYEKKLKLKKMKE